MMDQLETEASAERTRAPNTVMHDKLMFTLYNLCWKCCILMSEPAKKQVMKPKGVFFLLFV